MRKVLIPKVVPQQLWIELEDISLVPVGDRGLLEEHGSIGEGNGTRAALADAQSPPISRVVVASLNVCD